MLLRAVQIPLGEDSYESIDDLWSYLVLLPWSSNNLLVAMMVMAANRLL